MMRSTVLIHKPRNTSAVYGIGIIISAFFAVLYVGMQFLGLSGGDAGDFVTNAFVFGIPHAPGYPLYTLLGGLVIRLVPFFSVAWRIGLLSSIPTAVAIYFLWCSAFKITQSKWAATIASFGFGFLGIIWLDALTQEVFGLFLLGASLWIYLFILWKQTHTVHYVVWLTFLGVLAFTHHQLILLCIVPAVYSAIRSGDKIPLKTIWWKLMIAVCIGLLPYLYFPIAAHRPIPFDLENASTINGIFRLITRASYGTFQASASMIPRPVDRALNIFTFFQFSFRDISFVFWMYIILGCVTLRKRYRDIYDYFIGCLFLWLSYYFIAGFPLLLNFQVGTLERFFVVPYYILMLFVAQGIAWCIGKISHMFVTHTVWKWVGILSIVLVSLLSMIPRLKAQVRAYSYAKSTTMMERLADDMLLSAPHQSIIFTSEDTTTFAMYEALYVRHVRPDIQYVRLNLLGLPYYRQYLRTTYPNLYVPPETAGLTMNGLVADFFQHNVTRFPIMSDRSMSEISGLWIPYGLLYSYAVDEHAVLEYETLYQINKDLWAQFRVPVDVLPYHKELLLLSDALRVYSQHYTNMAVIAVYAHKPVEVVQQELKQALSWSVNVVPEYYIAPATLLIADKRCDDAKIILRLFSTTWGDDKSILRQYASWKATCGSDAEVDGKVSLFRKQFPKETDMLAQ